MKTKRLFTNIGPQIVIGLAILTMANRSSGSVDMNQDRTADYAESYGALFKLDANLGYIDARANDFRDLYLDNVLTAQKKLAPMLGKRGYSNAIRSELPGAPVGRHCIYGQFTQSTRATAALGDTLQLIPETGSKACAAFKASMRNRYSAPEYAGCIYDGKMYSSQDEFNTAFDKFVASKNIKSNNPDSVNKILREQFKNFCIDDIEPGTILVVPRYPGSTLEFHGIVYIGRGFAGKDNNFTPDSTGRHIFVANNNERMGDLFKTWDTRNVFAANMTRLARIEFAKEFERIVSSDRSDLIQYISNGKNDSLPDLEFRSTLELKRLARAKYFNLPEKPAPDIAALINQKQH